MSSPPFFRILPSSKTVIELRIALYSKVELITSTFILLVLSMPGSKSQVRRVGYAGKIRSEVFQHSINSTSARMLFVSGPGG